MEMASSRSAGFHWPPPQSRRLFAREQSTLERRAASLAPSVKARTIFLVHRSSLAGSPIKVALQERGYQVIHAESVTEALSLWGKSSIQIDLFLADISLGRDAGVERLVQLLQAENPRMRVLYANDLEQTTGPLMMGQSYPKQLVGVVDNCLA